MVNVSKIRNPFTSSESLTFGDLILRIEVDAELDSRKKRELLSAVRQVPKWLNRLPDEIPANAGFLRTALEAFHPDHAGITKRRYQNVVSHVKFAMKHCGTVMNETMYLAEFTPDWQVLWDLLDEKYLRSGLSRFFRFGSAQRIKPSDVNDRIFESFRLALEAEAITKKPRTQHQTACRLWNKCVASIEGWPQNPVTVPKYSEPYTKPIEAFPSAFQKDLQSLFDRLTHVDPFDDRSPPRALRPRSIKTKTMQIRQIAAALIHQGHDIEEITSLGYLVEHYKEALSWHRDRHGGKTSGAIAGLVDCIRSIAKYHVQVSEDDVRQIENVRARLTPENTGLTEKNQTRLQQFDNPRNVQALLWFGKQSFNKAVKSDDGSRQFALDASLALAVELLIHAPMRIENLSHLSLDRHLRWEKANCKGRLSIAIPGEEVKNGDPLHYPFPVDVSNMVREFLERFRARLFKGQNEFLFAGRNGMPKRSDTLSKQISKRLWDHCGLRLSPHQIRHFVAKQVVEATPGNYEGARRILGHRDSNTTYKHYEGMETKPAFEHWQRLITKTRGYSHPSEGPGLSDTRAMRRNGKAKVRQR